MYRIVTILCLSLLLGCSAEKEQLQLKTGYIEADGVNLYYEEMGAGETVIMIHGGFLNSAMWDGQFELIAENYRAVRYDVRGHGKSTADSVAFTDTEDLRVLMDSLKIDKAVLMGLSMGGGISVDFALKYPNNVSSLVLVGPGIEGFDYDTELLREFGEKLSTAETWDERKTLFAKYWMVGPFREVEEVNSAVYLKTFDMMHTSTQRWMFEPLKQLDENPAFNRLSEIDVPVLAIVGDQDMPVIMNIVDEIELKVPNVTKAVIEGAAHQVNMEKPAEFSRAVLDFLKKIE